MTVDHGSEDDGDAVAGPLTVSSDEAGGTTVERVARRLSEARQAPRRKPRAAASPQPDSPADPPPAPRPEQAPARPAVERHSAGKVTLDKKRLRRLHIYSPAESPNRTAEEFRVIKLAVLARVEAARAAGMSNARLAMVTSTREGEGKSFVSANLAMSLAMEKDRDVILVDADAARSAVARLFGLKVKHGLMEAISSDDVDPSSVLLETDIEGLAIIPAGRRLSLSPELLSSDRSQRFLSKLLADNPNAVVLFDAPPVLATGEPSALARHMGQVIFVVEAGRTGKAAIGEALDLVGICPSISFVLNKTQFQLGSVMFGKYYSYYYNKQSAKAADN